MAKFSHLTVKLDLDTSGVQAFIKSTLFQLWVIENGAAYNAATARVITAL